MAEQHTSDNPAELFYVNSKITDKENVSAELFAKWYDTVHLPDILVTSGIKKAYRYITTAEDVNSVERPYLALYMVLFEGFLSSKEFAEIPVASDLFPGPKHEVFDVADFDARCYKVDKLQKTIHDPYLLTVQYDEGQSIDALTDVDRTIWTFTCYFSRQNRRSPEESDIGTPPKRLALLWYPDQSQLESAAEKAASLGTTAQFKLLKDYTA